MKIGLIDVDNFSKLGDCFPNLALMKLSAYHKKRGDVVEWYDALFGGEYDRVYMSKVFNFSEDYDYFINSKEIIKGGSGYAIETVNGVEIFDKEKNINLSYEIEHEMPDYTLYYSDILDFKDGKLTNIGQKHRNTAYGFMSRGCPRGWGFCHVKDKEGLKSYKVADLTEFWSGQKYIELMDPNTYACKDWENITQQLIDSKSYVNFNQGVDIRMITKEKAYMINSVKTKSIHFAWDRWEDSDKIKPLFQQFRNISTISQRQLRVYVLTNFNTTHEQDLYRVEWLKANGYDPYVMIYDKQNLPRGHITRQLQRYVNMKAIFYKIDNFSQYKKETIWKAL